MEEFVSSNSELLQHLIIRLGSFQFPILRGKIVCAKSETIANAMRSDAPWAILNLKGAKNNGHCILKNLSNWSKNLKLF